MRQCAWYRWTATFMSTATCAACAACNSQMSPTSAAILLLVSLLTALLILGIKYALTHHVTQNTFILNLNFHFVMGHSVVPSKHRND